MATFKLPDLGEGLAEAEILEWHVKPGDLVRVDQPMVSVETAKAVVEVPVPYAGIVVTLHGAVGDVIATGAPLIEVDSGTVVGSMPVAAAHDAADDLGMDASTLERPRATGTGTRAEPLARALARRLGVDLHSVASRDETGVVRLDDVLAHAGLAGTSGFADLDIPEGASVEPLRGARRTMAYTMSQSRTHVAMSTVCDDADIEPWAARGDYMLRLIRALEQACRTEPALNAWYDPHRNVRILLPHVDLAIAVDTPHGLSVPVLRDIGHRTPAELRAAIAAHKDAARRRQIAVDDVGGFTLMLSNFGTLAGRYGIPLVVPPAVAILGAGKVRADAVVVGDRIAAHRRMPLSLSFDHRCVTGGEACRFLATVIRDLENQD